MNVIKIMSQDNYYTNINGIKVYVDYINERLKILDFQYISDNMIKDIVTFARKNDIGKVISNCRIKLLEPFRTCGFKIEGLINGFYNGEDAYCVSLFLNRKREVSPHMAEEDTILDQCVIETKNDSPMRNHNYMVRNAETTDIPNIIRLFLSVFETYPSPVFSSNYLQNVMDNQIVFKVAIEDGEIISIASADIDKFNFNAEITDCATYPEYRGKGILSNLIQHLEQDLRQKSIYTLYSLSRATNIGINKSLSKLEYRYSGRLVNNCHICGSFEDMNIWVKKL